MRGNGRFSPPGRVRARQAKIRMSEARGSPYSTLTGNKSDSRQLSTPNAATRSKKGAKVKRILSETMGRRVAKIAAPMLVFLLSVAAPAVSQTRVVDAAFGVASASPQAPKGVKVLAQVPLDGLLVTRMFTQWEGGRTYLYIEHGGQPLTAVDVTKKKNPQLVDHEPGKVEPKRYEEIAEAGGSIEVSPQWNVNAGVDNSLAGGRGMVSTLQSSDPDDAQLLQDFGRESGNLADRDRHLIFFASPAQLLIVEDGRWEGADYYATY